MKGYYLATKGDYLVGHAIDNRRKKKEARRKNVKDGVDKFKHEYRYHVYRDSTSFAYDIILVRTNIQQNKFERYVLRLCTTHDTPKYYATLLIYGTSGIPAHKSILAPIGSNWDKAFLAFTKAFKAKTKVEWEERLVLPAVREEGAFLYKRPTEGEARGLMDRDFEVGG
ncbi:MAG: hypothetical protein Q9222_001343 [Ikaeria aurantiellina]